MQGHSDDDEDDDDASGSVAGGGSRGGGSGSGGRYTGSGSRHQNASEQAAAAEARRIAKRNAELAEAALAVRQAAAAAARSLEDLNKVNEAQGRLICVRVDVATDLNVISGSTPADTARTERVCAFRAMCEQGYAGAFDRLGRSGDGWKERLFDKGYSSESRLPLSSER